MGEVARSLGVLGNSITASFESLKGELWCRDQSSPPLVLSIIFFRMVCVLSKVSAVATKAQSSTNPVESSYLHQAMSIRSVL